MGPGDDAAVLNDGSVITVDQLVEGVHWDERLSAADVGYKAVAVSVSDLAAMGARPQWMVLALALPRPVDETWFDAFATGLHEACDAFGVPLVGGDTTRSPGPRLVGVTMGGRAVGNPVKRSTGRVGDDLWVTGTPGLAAGGYLHAAPPAECLVALRHPVPPLAFALDVGVRGLATAMMDLSDGLVDDLPRLARASGVGAAIDPALLPSHSAFTAAADPLIWQVAGGDDFELLLAADPASRAALRELAAHHGVRLTRVGSLTAGSDVVLIGRVWPAPAFTHFGAP